ncbi:MAG: QueT transporter family protein [Candidatus Bathyarchaeia archaeon]|nr:QueT transporter family protein [Candidatus Bathyarchaeota archaeon]
MRAADRIDAHFISLSAVFAALYVVGVVVLAPISFYVTQVRVADALLPLTIIGGWPAILGVTIGCTVANFFGGLGALDVVGGGLANLAAGYVGWRVGRGRFKGSWLIGSSLQTLIVSAVVGGYLSFLLTVPFKVSFLGVFTGSLISVNGMGYILLKMLGRSRLLMERLDYGKA